MVGQRLARALALAAKLEAPQRPRQLIAVRRTTGYEVAERPQLVLVLGRDDEHAMRPPPRPHRERAPRAGADTRPRECTERDPAVAEQPQRAQQIPEHLTPLEQRALRVIVLGGVGDDQVIGLS